MNRKEENFQAGITKIRFNAAHSKANKKGFNPDSNDS